MLVFLAHFYVGYFSGATVNTPKGQLISEDLRYILSYTGHSLQSGQYAVMKYKNLL